MVDHGDSNNDSGLVISSTDQFGTYRCGTQGAEIFIFVSFGEDQKKALSYWDGAVTLRTIKFGRIKLLKGVLLGGASRTKRILSIDESFLHSRAFNVYKPFKCLGESTTCQI
jgi:hypothetical protein